MSRTLQSSPRLLHWIGLHPVRKMAGVHTRSPGLQTPTHHVPTALLLPRGAYKAVAEGVE